MAIVTTRYRIILSLSWLVLFTSAYAQVQQPDSVSLLKSILGMEDQMWVDYSAGLDIAQKLHQKATRSSCLSCQANSFMLLGKFFWANGEYQRGLVQFRTAVALARHIGDHKTLATTFNLMGNTYYYQAYYDSGFYFFTRALKIYEADKDMQGMITVLHNISLMYHRQGDFKKTIEYLFQEEQVKDRLPESIHEIEAMGAMGSLMIDSIYYREEIADELNDLKTYRLKGDKKSMARAYRNIAKAYRQLEEYVLAARYFIRSGTLTRELGMVPEWDLAATDYRDANIRDSCFYYHYLAKDNFNKMTQLGISYTLELLGDAHLHFGRPDSAKFYYDSAIRMNYRMNNRITFTGIHRYLVNVHRQLGDYPEAERHLKIGLELSKEVALIHEMNLYREGKALYEQMKDYRKALWFSEKYRLYRDSVTKAETAVNLTKLQAEFKTAKKTREIKDLQQINLLNEAQIETRNLQMALAVAMLTAIAIVGALYYSRYRQNQKLNKQLEIKNKEKEVLLHEIHHRVKNNLQIISSLINLKSGQSSNETLEVLNQLNARIYSIGLIHEKLYQKDNIQMLRLDLYLHELSHYLIQSFSEHYLPVKLSFQAVPIELDADKTLACGMICNEVITNSIKHAFLPQQVDRKIVIQLKIKDESIQWTIHDNGTKSTANPTPQSKSFGIRFVDQLVKSKLEGSWSIKSVEGLLTQIEFAYSYDGKS